MAINKLALDMVKISEILGYNYSVLDMSNVTTELFIDGKTEDKNMLPMEVVYDKESDKDFKNIESQITKIYNAFIYGEQSEFWKSVILEKFEPSTQIDFMLLVSFVYMRKSGLDNKETRIAEAMSVIAATLCKFIEV